MKRTTILILLATFLAVLVLLNLYFGCSFPIFERFENVNEMDTDAEDDDVGEGEEDDTEEAPVKLTPKEKEMFENIRNGTISDDDIQKFIADGHLTEKMVEKFLEQVDALPLPDEKEVLKKEQPQKKKLPAKDEEGFDVEGFSGDVRFAKY